MSQNYQILKSAPSLQVTIHLAVIQVLIADVVAETMQNNITTQHGNNQSNSYTLRQSPSDNHPGHDPNSCEVNIPYNISNMKEPEIKALITSQAEDINERKVNITLGFQHLEIITREFAKTPDFAKGHQAINLSKTYLRSSVKLRKSIEQHNSFVRAYKCMTKTQNKDTQEISEKDFQDTFNSNKDYSTQFYLLYNLALTYSNVFEQNEKYNASKNQVSSLQSLEALNKALEEMNITVQMINKFVQEQEKFHTYLENNTLHQNFKTEQMLYVSNVTLWRKELQKRKNNLALYEKYIADKRFEELLNKKIQPILHGIIFTFGIIGNLILLLIFARHKEMRNPPSMMILNLTLADTFNLPINIPAFLIYLTSSSWDYGEGLCITFRFLRQLGIAVSIYSIVIISIQRFLALTQMFKNNGFGSKLSTRSKSILLILSVWVLGSLIATPHAIHAGVYEGQCYGAPRDSHDYAKFITLFDLVLFCAIPLTLIATLSVATAFIIKRSVRNIPGEAMGMDKYIKTRIVSANVLIALTVVSAASYFPYYLFMFLFAWENPEIETQSFQIIFFVVYTLVFANCCFNPLALYIFSHKFRRYIHKYLFCRKIKGFDGPKHSGGTTSSSFITKI